MCSDENGVQTELWCATNALQTGVRGQFIGLEFQRSQDHSIPTVARYIFHSPVDIDVQ